jgi:hypothetical protein
MQVTELQVQRSLQALTNEVPVDPPAVRPSGEAHERPIEAAHQGHSPDELPDGLVEQLTHASPIRDGRIDAVRRRLEAGERPSAEALAQRMVGRLVCDRLR